MRRRRRMAAGGKPGTVTKVDGVWVGWSGDVADPQSPDGGGGPGRFRPALIDDAAQQVDSPSPFAPVPMGTGATPPKPKAPNPPPATSPRKIGVLKSQQTDLLNVKIEAEILADTSGGPAEGADTGFTGGMAFTAPGYATDAHRKIVSFDAKFEWTGTVTIQTDYASSARPTHVSCYGRGTTTADVAAGDITLGFHESCHRADYVAYLSTNSLPDPPAMAIGMTEGAYKAAVETFRKAVIAYFKTMGKQSETNTDEVGFRRSTHLATQKCYVHVTPP